MTALHPGSTQNLPRLRAGARATLTLGIGASLAANVLAAEPSIVGRIIAAWSPLALLLTVELISRLPVGEGWLSRLRVTAAATIAGIAAWVSYWHMVEVAESHGEAAVAAHLLPFSVDGLVVVASVALVELSNNSHDDQARSRDTGTPNHSHANQRRSVTNNGTRPSEALAATSSPTAASPAATTKAAVLALAKAEPELTQAEIADRVGVSTRTVRRHLTAAQTTLTTQGTHQ